MNIGKVLNLNSESNVFNIKTETKTYSSLKEHLLDGDIKDGDIVSFLITKFYINGQIVLMADYVKKESELILKKQ